MWTYLSSCCGSGHSNAKAKCSPSLGNPAPRVLIWTCFPSCCGSGYADAKVNCNPSLDNLALGPGGTIACSAFYEVRQRGKIKPLQVRKQCIVGTSRRLWFAVENLRTLSAWTSLSTKAHRWHKSVPNPYSQRVVATGLPQSFTNPQYAKLSRQRPNDLPFVFFLRYSSIPEIVAPVVWPRTRWVHVIL